MARQPENAPDTSSLRMSPQMEAAARKAVEIAAGLPPLPENPSPEEVRARTITERRYWNENPVPLAAVEDIALPGPFGDIPARVYRPQLGHTSPVIVHFHGGGWVKGSYESHDRIGRVLARESSAVVVSVDYALAPENKFPVPLEECLAAALAVHAQAAELRVDPGRMVLAGDSAGANLAMAAALDLRFDHPGLIKALLLFYGVFDTDLDTESYQAFGGGEFGLSRDDMAAYWNAYLRGETDRENPRAAPIKADLTDLPPTFLAAAGLDVLRDDTLKLAKRLRDDGLPHELRRYEGVCHAFVGLGRMVEAGDQALADAATYLRESLKAS